jgi:ribose 5-phosphate isomerase
VSSDVQDQGSGPQEHEAEKRAAAHQAVHLIKLGMVGLGSGSTVDFTLPT